MNRNLRFSIKDIATSPVGSKLHYSFDVPPEFPEIDTKSNLTGEVEIMRLEDGFHVVVSDIAVDVEFVCVKSLKPFTETVKVKKADRIFFIDLPKLISDPNDIFLIDKKKLELDISELLRQEIILHFPASPVCYDGSGELSEYYTDEEMPENKPLSVLKDLLNQ